MRKNGDVMHDSVASLDNESESDKSPLIVRNFYDQGLLDYHQIHEKMLHFTQNRNEETPDEIWLLQHHRVFTQGQAGKPEHGLFAVLFWHAVPIQVGLPTPPRDLPPSHQYQRVY